MSEELKKTSWKSNKGPRGDRTESAERQRQALELRKAGVDYETIAIKLGYADTSGAHKAVTQALKKTLREPADAVRVLEEKRLDALFIAVWQKARNGDGKALDNALKIMDRRAKLLGLDRPMKHEVSGPKGCPIEIDLAVLSDEQLEQLSRGISVDAAPRPSGVGTPPKSEGPH